MKFLRLLFTVITTCIITLIPGETYASGKTDFQGSGNDSVEISLLTCSPGQEVYSLYGHTAIRYTDYKKDIDIAINYGVFSFKKSFFILRFIFGLTDYEMGIIPFDVFYEEYKSNGRGVIQQKLNLTEEEKSQIISAIEENYRPENRVYRYNYFYDNCTTRAHDILINNVKGDVEIAGQQKREYPSFRELIHSFNENHPWARFGNDMLLGVGADKMTDKNTYQFLPFNLMNDFDKTVIKDKDGNVRKLVEKTFNVVPEGFYSAGKEFPLRPSDCAWIIFSIIIAVTFAEYLLKKDFRVFDALLMAVDGCVGIVIFVMFFSEHPTTSTNLQILLFNPLPLFFIHRVVKKTDKKTLWLYASASLILFFIGGFFQDYAEGTFILASSLLIRCIWKIMRLKKNDK